MNVGSEEDLHSGKVNYHLKILCCEWALVITAQTAEAGGRRCLQANRIEFYHMDEVSPPFQQLFFILCLFSAMLLWAIQNWCWWVVQVRLYIFIYTVLLLAPFLDHSIQLFESLAQRSFRGFEGWICNLLCWRIGIDKLL
jgi:hypothetical protein